MSLVIRWSLSLGLYPFEQMIGLNICRWIAKANIIKEPLDNDLPEGNDALNLL